MTRIMTNLAKITLGAAIAVSPAVVFAQNAGTDNSGAAQTGSSSMNQPGTATDNNATNSGTAPANNGAVNTNPSGTSNTGNQTGTANGTSNFGNQNGTSNRTMPRTASGWLDLLFSGAALSAAGVALRRLRRA